MMAIDMAWVPQMTKGKVMHEQCVPPKISGPGRYQDKMVSSVLQNSNEPQVTMIRPMPVNSGVMTIFHSVLRVDTNERE